MNQNTRLEGRKIVLACKYLFGITGGAERNVVDIANFLSVNGARVTIIVYEKHIGAPAFRLLPGVQIVNARKDNSIHGEPSTEEQAAEEARRAEHDFSEESLDWYRATLSMRLHWERAIRRLSPELIITFLPHTSTYVLEQLRTEFPILVTNQNRPEEDYFNPERHDPSPFDRKKRLRNLDFAHAIQVLVPDFVDELPSHLRPKIHVIPNNVPTQPMVVQATKAPIIVAMGRLVPQKGFDILVEAMRIVAQQEPNWRLYLYGRGPERDRLIEAVRRASLQRHVILRGRTGRPLDAMSEASLFVIPSRYEGWGLTLSEAMSIGLPAIGFADCTGVNWLLRDPACGRLVHERTPAALAAAILELIRDDALRNRLGEQGKQHVQQYSPEKVETIWLKLIDQMLDQPVSR